MVPGFLSPTSRAYSVIDGKMDRRVSSITIDIRSSPNQFQRASACKINCDMAIHDSYQSLDHFGPRTTKPACRYK